VSTIAAWWEDLAYHFQNEWREHAEPDKAVPETLFNTVTHAIGRAEFMPTLTHPTGADEAISFVMIDEDDAALLVRFDPPSTTRLDYVGSLVGGRYTETISVAEDGDEIDGLFMHDRLDAPLRLRLKLPPERGHLSSTTRSALEKASRFRDKLRAWSTEPQPRQTQ
jgi:hypothetical protein